MITQMIGKTREAAAGPCKADTRRKTRQEEAISFLGVTSSKGTLTGVASRFVIVKVKARYPFIEDGLRYS
jgi:hypothetical protein